MVSEDSKTRADRHNLVAVRRAEQARKKRKLTERESLDLSMLCYLPLLVLESIMAKENMQARADWKQVLELGSVAPFAHFDDLSVARLAKRIDADAREVLKEAGISNLRHLMLSVCRLILILVDQGRVEDKANSGVLFALAVMEEATVDPESGWQWHAALSFDRTKQMKYRLNWLGYQMPVVDAINCNPTGPS